MPVYDFNPRAPRGARPQSSKMYEMSRMSFQSTCPARGTTKARLLKMFT